MFSYFFVYEDLCICILKWKNLSVILTTAFSSVCNERNHLVSLVTPRMREILVFIVFMNIAYFYQLKGSVSIFVF